MSRKNKIKRMLIALQIVCPIVAIISVFACVWMYNSYEDRVRNIENYIDLARENDSKEDSLSDMIRRNNPFVSIRITPISEDSISVRAPLAYYEFTDMDMRCNDFAMDNDLWYAYAISPYISPGVEGDIYLRGDNNEHHWIKMHVINTDAEDTSLSDCTVFSLSIHGLDGYEVGGISVGDKLEDVIRDKGTPSSFSISDYDVISGLTYDYDNFAINAVANVLTGKVEDIEVVCKSVDNYRNGKWR